MHVLAQILIAISSLALSAAVFYYTKRTVAIESMRGVRDSWMQVDQTVLDHPDDLRIADALFNPRCGLGTGGARKRAAAHLVLNPRVAAYVVMRAHPLPTPGGADAEPSMRLLRAVGQEITRPV